MSKNEVEVAAQPEQLEAVKQTLDIAEIMAILPHRYPFLLIDRVVLQVEAIAQAGGALLLTEIPDRDQKLMVFAGIDSAKFRKPVVPGDQLRLEVTVLNWRQTAVKLLGIGTVDGKVACEATITCMLVPRAAKPAATKDQTA
jgi:3-hydroxyacyl-[acyl-carrier-protein] dehydratase